MTLKGKIRSPYAIPGFRKDLRCVLAEALLRAPTRRYAFVYTQFVLAKKYCPPMDRQLIPPAINPSLKGTFAHNIGNYKNSQIWSWEDVAAIGASIGFEISPPYAAAPVEPSNLPPLPRRDVNLFWHEPGSIIIRRPVLAPYDLGDPPPGRSALDRSKAANPPISLASTMNIRSQS